MWYLSLIYIQTLSHVYLSSSTEMISLIFDVFPSLSVQFKILNVPLSSHLAANHFNQQQAEQEERMRMKKLTLDINERQEQEDYQGERTAGAHAALCVFVYLLVLTDPCCRFRNDAISRSETCTR